MLPESEASSSETAPSLEAQLVRWAEELGVTLEELRSAVSFGPPVDRQPEAPSLPEP